jgi:UDP-N-acetylmuramyl tripeptide synthase
MAWRADAVGCPACDGRIDYTQTGWSCSSCGLGRPEPDAWIETANGRDEVCFADGRRIRVSLAIPGRFNVANAAMAACAAEVLGVRPERALASMATVGEVAGRFSVHRVAGRSTRLMLAKNPAGWRELLDLVCPGTGPVVVGINARVADGRDPSWLWDVPFERLAGRPVVATGERCLDLAVRLRYAGVEHRTVADPVAAVAEVALVVPPGGDRPTVDFIGNYTAFYDLMARQ